MRERMFQDTAIAEALAGIDDRADLDGVEPWPLAVDGCHRKVNRSRRRPALRRMRRVDHGSTDNPSEED